MTSESIDFASEPESEETGMHWSRRSSAASSGSHASPPHAHTGDDPALIALQQRLLQDKAVQQNPALRNNIRLISQVLQKKRAEQSRSLNGSQSRDAVDGEHDHDHDDDDDAQPAPQRAPPRPTSQTGASHRTQPPWQIPTESPPGMPLLVSSANGAGSHGASSGLFSQSGGGGAGTEGSLFSSSNEGLAGMRSNSLSVDRFLRAVSQVDSFAVAAEQPKPVSSSPSEDADEDMFSSIVFEEGGGTSRSHSQRNQSSHRSTSASVPTDDDDNDNDDDDDGQNGEREAALRAVLSSNTRRPESSQRRSLSNAAATAPAGTRLSLHAPQPSAQKSPTPRRPEEGTDDEEEDEDEDAPRPFGAFPLSPSPSGAMPPVSSSSSQQAHLPPPHPSFSGPNQASLTNSQQMDGGETPSVSDTTHLLGTGSAGRFVRPAGRTRIDGPTSVDRAQDRGIRWSASGDVLDTPEQPSDTSFRGRQPRDARAGSVPSQGTTPWSRAADRYQRELITPVKCAARSDSGTPSDEEEEEEELKHLVPSNAMPRTGKAATATAASAAAADARPLPAPRPRPSALSVSAVAAVTAAQEKREQEERAREARADAEAMAKQAAEEAARSRSTSMIGRFMEALSPSKRRQRKKMADHADDASRDEVSDAGATATGADQPREDEASHEKDGPFRRFSRRLSEFFGGKRKRKKGEKNNKDKKGTTAGKGAAKPAPPSGASATLAGKSKVPPPRPAAAARAKVPPPSQGFKFPASSSGEEINGGRAKGRPLGPSGGSSSSSRSSSTHHSELQTASMDVPFPAVVSGSGGRKGRGGGGGGRASGLAPPLAVPAPAGVTPPAKASASGRGGSGAQSRGTKASRSAPRSGRGDNLSVLSDLVLHELPQNALFAAADSRTSDVWLAAADDGHPGQNPQQQQPPQDAGAGGTGAVVAKKEYGETPNVPAAAEAEAAELMAHTASSVDFDVAESELFPSIRQMRQSLHTSTRDLGTGEDGDEAGPGVEEDEISQLAPKRRSRKPRETRKTSRRPSRTTPQQQAADLAQLDEPPGLFSSSAHAVTGPSSAGPEGAKRSNAESRKMPSKYFAPYNPDSLLVMKRQQAMEREKKKAYAERRRTVNAYYSHLSLTTPEKTAQQQANRAGVIDAHDEQPGMTPTASSSAPAQTPSTQQQQQQQRRAHRKLSWGHTGPRQRRRRRSSTTASSVALARGSARPAARTGITPATIHRLRQLSPAQFRKHVLVLARQEARLQHQLQRLDDVLEKKRRQRLVRDAQDQSMTTTAATTPAGSAAGSPARTPRTAARPDSASPSSPLTIHKADVEEEEKVAESGERVAKRAAPTTTRATTTATGGSTALAQRRKSPPRQNHSNPSRDASSPSSSAASGGYQHRRPRPPLQRYYDDLVELTMHPQRHHTTGTTTITATTPSGPRSAARPSSTPRPARVAEAEEEPVPEAFAPRPFLHSVPSDTARLREALYHEYYYTTDTAPSHAALVMAADNNNSGGSPGESRVQRTVSPLRPSCAACGPQSAPAYASLALHNLADQLVAVAAEAEAVAEATPSSSARPLQQAVREDLYSPYRGRQGKKPPRKAGLTTTSDQALSSSSLPPSSLSRLASYPVPFTPSPRAVIAYGLQRELIAAESRARAVIEEDELNACVDLCEDLVQVLIAEKAREVEAERACQDDHDADKKEEEDVEARTVVVRLPSYVAHGSHSCEEKEEDVTVTAVSPPPPPAQLPSHADSDSDVNLCVNETSDAHSSQSSSSTSTSFLSPTVEPRLEEEKEEEEANVEKEETAHVNDDRDSSSRGTSEEEATSEKGGMASATHTASPSSSSSSIPFVDGADEEQVDSEKSVSDGANGANHSTSSVHADDEAPAQDALPTPPKPSEDDRATSSSASSPASASLPVPKESEAANAEPEATAHDPFSDDESPDLAVQPVEQKVASSSSSTSSASSVASVEAPHPDENTVPSASEQNKAPHEPETDTKDADAEGGGDAAPAIHDKAASSPTASSSSDASQMSLPFAADDEAADVIDNTPNNSSSAPADEAQPSVNGDGDGDDAAVNDAETPRAEDAPRRRSVHWPEEVVTERHEADIFLSNSTTSTSTSSRPSPSPSPAADEVQAETQDAPASTAPFDDDESAGHDDDAAVASPTETAHVEEEKEEESDEKPATPAAAEVVLEREASEPFADDTEEEAEKEKAEEEAEAAAPPVLPRLSLGALTDHANAIDAADATLVAPSLEAESAALALLDKLNGLDALLLSEFPHYFAKGSDADGRPTAVLRNEAPGTLHTTGSSAASTRSPSIRNSTLTAMEETATTTTPPERPRAGSQSHRIPLSTRPLVLSSSSASGSGLFPVRRGSYASRGLTRDVPLFNGRNDMATRWSIQKSPREAQYEP